ncbi:MAG: mechanosensitive ion channel [Gammaproteobacteria bacterium]|nr:mechanosensitive ion channel [Rhodocyclaceae bacterium]MBU3907619.1 mechanosensitive ion channel [Gammaproteobacteria bacterium]MBU3990893.1 mechanosensitive ion channel [Gammaproteobacteria bacterium]MBU4004265.1 mechanosensitive ion channel [Gammaproteobacteria bacterium]MBU4019674.1 mechanosensitive ion channel [Gammaproteobacteria bacterium]
MIGTDIQIGGLLIDLWQDLQQPNVLWQVAVLIACFALAWNFARWVGERVGSGTNAEGEALPEGVARAFGRRSFKRLGWPIAMLLLTLAARPLLAQWHNVNLLSLAIPLLTSLVVIRAVMFVVRHSLIASAPWLASFERTLAFLAWSVVALHLLGVLPETIALMEGVSFSFAKQDLNLWLILQGMGAVFGTLLVALWIGGAIEARLLNAQGLDGNLRLVFARLARALLILLAVLIGLPLVGIDLTMLSVFGGALGVGLGFGLQKIAANYVSGFIILLDRSIRIGNMIAVGSQRGVVTRITTRYTVLLARSGLEMIVPNEMLVSSVIANETYTDHKVRIPLQVQVAYGSDLEQVQQILIDAALTQPRVLHDPLPRGHVAAFGDSGVNFELRFWIGDPENGLMQVKSDINLAIWKAFKAAGIEIPFPQREVRLLQN